MERVSGMSGQHDRQAAWRSQSPATPITSSAPGASANITRPFLGAASAVRQRQEVRIREPQRGDCSTPYLRRSHELREWHRKGCRDKCAEAECEHHFFDGGQWSSVDPKGDLVK